MMVVVRLPYRYVCIFICATVYVYYIRTYFEQRSTIYRSKCETVPRSQCFSLSLSSYTVETAPSPRMACRYPFSPAKVAITRFFYPSPLSRSTTPLFCPPSCRIRVGNTSRMLTSSSSVASEDPKSEMAKFLASPNPKSSASEPGPSPHDVLSAPTSAGHISEAEETLSDQLRNPGSSSSSSPSQSSTNNLSSKNAPFKLSSTYSLPSNISVPPEVREHLIEWSKNVLEHSRYVIQEAQKKFVGLGLKVNEMTGYHEVERLKYMVFEKGTAFLPRSSILLTFFVSYTRGRTSKTA